MFARNRYYLCGDRMTVRRALSFAAEIHSTNSRTNSCIQRTRCVPQLKANNNMKQSTKSGNKKTVDFIIEIQFPCAETSIEKPVMNHLWRTQAQLNFFSYSFLLRRNNIRSSWKNGKQGMRHISFSTRK